MSSKPVISVKKLGKRYQRFANPRDRLKQLIWPASAKPEQEFWALKDASFDVMSGEVFGIVGRNGAGKSTLLQLVCGTLSASTGDVSVHGRVAALLELGAGFNPEFSARENIFMSASIMGLSREETAALYDEIVEFSGVGAFIEQPMKTFSSGMYVRLAFAVATAFTPDILIIDEALSVGDGAFSRKSFDRIMALKEAGKTILFCSHSMYQIDALCERALWLEDGKVRMLGAAGDVTSAYNTALAVEIAPESRNTGSKETALTATAKDPAAPPSSGRIVNVSAKADGKEGSKLELVTGESHLSLRIEFIVDPELDPPTVAFAIETAAGVMVTSLLSTDSQDCVHTSPDGAGYAQVEIEKLPLMKGDYRVSAFLACEKGLHVYDWVPQSISLKVTQTSTAQGVVVLPHKWQ
ncbi:MAG: ABC transporter ATP-binding protein [Pseudohongiellaceae bacterium]|nr:ABC transporter ATP-binding protein [Pseudohongiellaceae bacterium]